LATHFPSIFCFESFARTGGVVEEPILAAKDSLVFGVAVMLNHPAVMPIIIELL
jgi:hypothetical protein